MIPRLESSIKKTVVVLETLCSTLFFLVCFIVLLQVVARFILKVSTPWSEELARFLLVILVFMGASVSLKEKSHLIALDIFSGRSERTVNIGKLLTNGIILSVNILYFRNSIRMAVIAGTEMAASMIWLKTRYLYILISVGFLFSTAFSAFLILETLLDMRKGGKND